MWARVAPSATRTPSSRVRRLARYAIRLYTPTTATRNPTAAMIDRALAANRRPNVLSATIWGYVRIEATG